MKTNLNLFEKINLPSKKGEEISLIMVDVNYSFTPAS